MMIEIIMALFGIAALAFITLIVVMETKNSRRKDCRCCGMALHEPGGYALIFVGSGFCDDCAAKILTAVRQC